MYVTFATKSKYLQWLKGVCIVKIERTGKQSNFSELIKLTYPKNKRLTPLWIQSLQNKTVNLLLPSGCCKEKEK